MDTVTLERLKLVALTDISRELVEDFAIAPKVEVSAMSSFITDGVAIRITQMVYGRTMEEVRAEYPADWWQAFKEQWAPSWVKKLTPVKWTRIRLEAKELYPKLSAPDYGPQLQLYRHQSFH